MNYIYDIVLNFQDQYWNFYEWSPKDKITTITKIPVFRVTDKDILILKNNIIKIDNEFLNKIKETNRKYKRLICLVSNTKLTIGLMFDKDGNLSKRSSLIFEEEDEVNTLCRTIPLTKIKYITNKEIPNQNNLRTETKKKNTIKNYIDKLENPLTLKYLYYDYYKEECTNKEKIKESLKKELEKSWTLKQNNLYELVTILAKNHLPMK